MTLKDIETRLSEIKQQRSNLLRQLDDLGDERYKLTMEKHGIEVGMLVEAAGKVYKIEGIRSYETGTPWLTGYLRLKDGSFGKQRKTIYNSWKRVSK